MALEIPVKNFAVIFTVQNGLQINCRHSCISVTEDMSFSRVSKLSGKKPFFWWYENFSVMIYDASLSGQNLSTVTELYTCI